MSRILAVDDDPVIADMVVKLLIAERIDAMAVYSGPEALDVLAHAAAEDDPFDLAILDIMMPGMDGFEVCRRIRRDSEMPVIFLSAKDEEIDKVLGLSLGGDDYVVKPFLPREFIARVHARLRRTGLAHTGDRLGGHRAAGGPHTLSAQGIDIDTDAHTAFFHDIPLKLTPKEFNVLRMLLENQGKPVSSKDIFETCWHERFDDSAANTVMVHIRRLRRKLADIDASVAPIKTVWGVGYKIEGTSIPTPLWR